MKHTYWLITLISITIPFVNYPMLHPHQLSINALAHNILTKRQFCTYLPLITDPTDLSEERIIAIGISNIQVRTNRCQKGNLKCFFGHYTMEPTIAYQTLLDDIAYYHRRCTNLQHHLEHQQQTLELNKRIIEQLITHHNNKK